MAQQSTGSDDQRVHGLVTAQHELARGCTAETTRSTRSQRKTARHAGSPLPEERASCIDLTDVGLLGLVLSGQGSSRAAMVGVAGFEPTAPRSQSECATKLRHTPLLLTVSVRRHGCRPWSPPRRSPDTG